MEGKVRKGTVLSINGNNARVAPSSNIELVSPSLQIADYINSEELKKGSSVAYVLFTDMTGLIFAKLE